MKIHATRCLGVTLVLAAAPIACSSSPDTQPPDYTSLSQLNAIWGLSGKLSFMCSNGVPVNENIGGGANVRVFDGVFDALEGLSVKTCGVDSIRFQGAIDLTGAITGNFSTTGASPLVDTFTGTCTTTSCTGSTSNPGLFSFTFSNSHEDVYDGTIWEFGVVCADGNGRAVMTPATIANDGVLQDASSFTCPGSICTASGSTPASSGAVTLTGMVATDGTLSATFAQGSGDTLTFDGTTNTSFTSLTGTGTYGAQISMKQCSSTTGSGLPQCTTCIITN